MAYTNHGSHRHEENHISDHQCLLPDKELHDNDRHDNNNDNNGCRSKDVYCVVHGAVGWTYLQAPSLAGENFAPTLARVWNDAVCVSNWYPVWIWT